MKCIIVDNEPADCDAIRQLTDEMPQLELLMCFNNATDTSAFIRNAVVDLIILNINVPGVDAVEFLRDISRHTLIILTTVCSRYDCDSYEVDVIECLVKPVDPVKFRKAVCKAIEYHSMLINEEDNN